MGRVIEVQIQRILEKLNQVRCKGLTCFGAESHKFRLNPPIAEPILNGFEAKHRIKLPPHYRSFLKLAGNGGAGPYYGIYRLEQWDDFLDWATDHAPTDLINRPSPLHPAMKRHSDWVIQFPNCVSPYQGMISIGSQGCTYAMGLIVTGEYSGRVVYLDADGQAPYVVREPDFLSWYERWLDELLGGYDLFWFGYGLGGDESTLLRLLDDPKTPDEDRIDAAYALRRLPGLSPVGRERIRTLICDSVAGVRAASCYIAEKFNIMEATTQIPNLLNDASPEVLKAAISMSMKLQPDFSTEEVIKLLYSDDLVVTKQAFFKLQQNDKLSRQVLLDLVQSFSHGELRALAAHAIEWKPEDETLLIRLLQDEHPQVRHYAVLGLRQISSTSSLGMVIELLGIETRSGTIGSILRMLGEVPGERNGEVLLAWAADEDDFHRLSAIDSLCKLGDIRVKPIAESLLGETRSPRRCDEDGVTSHIKTIGELVRESLCSSPNQTLRRLGSRLGWLFRKP